MKKKLAATLSVVLILGMAVLGILAYLSDTDSDVNVMTLGEVSITQNEQQRVEKDGEFTSELEDFKQGKILMPVTYPGNRTTDTVAIGDYTVELSDKEANYVDKIISVTNDGESAAYVRTLVAVPTGGADWEPTPVTANNCWLHWNIPSGYDTYWTLNSPATFVEIDGIGYFVWEFVHKEALASGETTYPMVRGFYMDQKVDNDDNGFYMTYADGTTKRIDDFTAEDTVDILVVSQAVQAEGFADAQIALDTAFGDITADNHPWKTAIPEDAVGVSDMDGLTSALATGGNYYIDAPITVNENLIVGADTVIYCEDDANVLTFEDNAKVTVNKDTSLELYGVQMDAEGTYSFDADGNIKYDADARRTAPLLNVKEGADLTVGDGTVIENVVAKGSAVLSIDGTANNRATVTIKGATIQNCAGESGTIINVNKASDVTIEAGTVIKGNASYNNNNHGIIRVYNAWDAANPSTVTMNGGLIYDNYYSGNGMVGLYYGKMIMNGGSIYDNSWFADNQVHNGWYPVVYAHSNSQFIMNGGGIYDNVVKYGVINSLNSKVEGALTINGGTITNNIATDNGDKDAFAVVKDKSGKSLVVSDNANVTGTVWVYYGEDGERDGSYYSLSEYFGN